MNLNKNSQIEGFTALGGFTCEVASPSAGRPRHVPKPRSSFSHSPPQPLTRRPQPRKSLLFGAVRPAILWPPPHAPPETTTQQPMEDPVAMVKQSPGQPPISSTQPDSMGRRPEQTRNTGTHRADVNGTKGECHWEARDKTILQTLCNTSWEAKLAAE